MTRTLTFESRLPTTRAALWSRIVDVDALRTEMMPFLAMKFPKGVRRLDDMPLVPGKPLFRCPHLYAGFLPLDWSDLTFIEMEPGRLFVEQSPMGSMRQWTHRREILDLPNEPDMVLLRDTLTFEPRFASGIAAWGVSMFFRHRHQMLRRAVAAASSPARQ